MESSLLRGGVVNLASTCYVSVVLQEFAQFPRVYGSLLSRMPCLQLAVNSLRSGHNIEPSTILSELHWQDNLTERIYGVLVACLPALFAPALGSPFRFYEHICSEQIPGVLTIDDDAARLPHEDYDVDKRIQSLKLPAQLGLVRVRLPLGKCSLFSEAIHCDEHRLALMQVHYAPYPKHIATACRIRDRWLHLDDHNVMWGTYPSPNQAVLLIYGLSNECSLEDRADDWTSLDCES